MENRERLDRAKIEEALRIMDQYLLDRKTLGEIAIYGGSGYPIPVRLAEDLI